MSQSAKRGRYEIDMTRGPMLPKVLLFTLPLVMTGVLQLLYNAADVIVVGRFAGTQALAAVGSTSSLINLMTNLFMGLSVGVSVVVARAFGAGDLLSVRRAVHTSITIAGIMGIVVGIFGFLMARPMLQLMSSPEDVIDLAASYVRIFFLGMPFNMLYNFGAAVLRATGDTRRPLIYLSFAGMVNVLLNLLLVIQFGLGVSGVAIATVVSQVISCVLVMLCLLRSDTAIRVTPSKLRIHWTEMKSILRLGLPAGLQSCLFSISNVMIQSAINSFGSVVVAGNSAACNLEGFVYISMNSLYQADQTFCSQNMGAKQYARVRRTLVTCTGVCIVIGLALAGVFLLAGRPLLSLYNTDPDVIAYGLRRMAVILPTYFICGIMDTIVGQLRGIGYSIMPMIVSLTGACLLRIVWIMTVFAANPTLETLYISYPISWTITWVAHLICYLTVVRRLPRQNEPLPDICE